MAISSESIDLLNRLIGVASLRQQVIAQNIANVNTPGYQTLSVSFEDTLNEALAAGNTDIANAADPQVMPGAGGVECADGNNVDVDLEITRLQKNSLYYQAYTQIVANKLAQLRSAIAGR